MAAEVVDRLAIWVAVRRFPSMGGMDSRSLRHDTYIRMQHFVRRSINVPFRRFLGMCGEKYWSVLLPLFTLLWILIFATPCNRVLLIRWHFYLFLGLRDVGFSPPFSFLLGGFHFFFM
jgi:hypothetical protein